MGLAALVPGPTSIEVRVKQSRFNRDGVVFDFGSGKAADNVYLSNARDTRAIRWSVLHNKRGKHLETGEWDASTWTHIVATTKSTTLKLYCNGILAGIADGVEPRVLERESHVVGAVNAGGEMKYFLDGTVAYVRIWHGVELTEGNAKSLFEATGSSD